MNLFKRALAGILTACTVLTTCTACGENTAVAMTIDGKEIPAGIYLYYVATAYSEAKNTIETTESDKFSKCESTSDIKKIMKSCNIGDKSAAQWIEDKAVESCRTYVATINEFDKLGLTLSGEELASIESSLVSCKNYYGQFFKENGISDSSFKEIITLSHKQDAIYDAYYGENGSEGITDEELRTNYLENHLRFKYVEMPLKDGEGNLLKSDGKQEIENMANGFIKRLEAKADDEAAMMKEFDDIIEENKAYITSLSAAAVTTTDENGQTITTPTTVKTTATAAAEGTTTAPDGDTAAVGTTAPVDAGENATTATVAVDGTTTTDTAATTTTVAGTTDSASAEQNTTTSTTVTTAGVGYAIDNERIVEVSTAPAEAPDESSSNSVQYNPCKPVYEYVADSKTPLNKPTLIKDDENYYVVVKLDLEDRMTDNDLWTESAKDNVCYGLYHQPLMDRIADAGDQLPLERNEKAFSRYHVLDVDVKAYERAIQTSLYDYYRIQQNGMGY